MKSKLRELYLKSFNTEADVLILSETWLNETIVDNDVFCNEFNVFRYDRNAQVSDKSVGGGVLIALRSTFQSKEIKSLYTDIEFICVESVIYGKTFLFSCSYVPPKSSNEIYKKHADSISYAVKQSPNAILFLMGDFNLPKVSWIPDPEAGSFLIPVLPEIVNDDPYLFIDECCVNGIVQINNVTNRNKRTLDLVFTDSPEFTILGKADNFLFAESEHHSPIDIKYCIESFSNTQTATRSYKLDFKKVNEPLFLELFQNYDWNTMFSDSDVNRCVAAFNVHFKNCLSVCSPLVKAPIDVERSPWLSKDIRTLRNKKSKLFRKYQLSLSVTDYVKYSAARRELQFKLKGSYLSYVRKIQQEISDNPKTF